MTYIALCVSGSELANSLKQKSEDQAKTRTYRSHAYCASGSHIVFCFEWQQVKRCVVVYIWYLVQTRHLSS